MSDTAEAGDSPALHEGSYPYLHSGPPQGLTTYPEVIRSLSPPKGKRLDTTGPPGTLASSQQRLQELWHFYS